MVSKFQVAGSGPGPAIKLGLWWFSAVTALKWCTKPSSVLPMPIWIALLHILPIMK